MTNIHPWRWVLIGLALFWGTVACVVTPAGSREVTISACVTEDARLVGSKLPERGYTDVTVNAADTGEVLGTFKVRRTEAGERIPIDVQLTRATVAEGHWGQGDDRTDPERGFARFPLCPPTQETTTTWPVTTTTPPETTAPSTTLTSSPPSSVPEITVTEPTIVPSTTSSFGPPTTPTSSTSTPSTTAHSPSTSEAPTTTGQSGSSSTTVPPSMSVPPTPSSNVTSTTSPTGEPTTSTPDTSDGSDEPRRLPRTGATTNALAVVGFALVGVGGSLVLVTRRRTT